MKSVGAQGGRKTALTLVIAIIAFELLANHQIQAAWSAMWGAVEPLGSGMNPGSSGSSGGSNSGSNSGPAFQSGGAGTKPFPPGIK